VTLALSIRQPWASLIIHNFKHLENRNWSTNVRGPILIHAAKGMSNKEHQEAMDFAYRIDPGISLFEYLFEADNLPRGGIIGSVNLVDCVRWSNSPWFQGPFAFRLCDNKAFSAEDFIPYKGQLGFFDVPGVEP
jgi:hypothetical protein